LKNAKKYGVQLASTRNDWTKTDWEMFYAAASESDELKHLLYDRLAMWLRETKSTFPFQDYYNIIDGRKNGGFINRPVIGGVFAPLTIGIHK